MATFSSMDSNRAFPVPQGSLKSHQRHDGFFQSSQKDCIWRSGEGGVTVQVFYQFVLTMDSSGCTGFLPHLSVSTHPK